MQDDDLMRAPLVSPSPSFTGSPSAFAASDFVSSLQPSMAPPEDAAPVALATLVLEELALGAAAG